MDFNKFQEWCQNRGFVVKLPSGYPEMVGLTVKKFESFKGLFNLCMLFFYEEQNRIKDEEMKECLKNLDKQPIALYRDGDNEPSAYKINFENGSSISPFSYINSKKYSDEVIQKVFNYLVTPNDNGIVPMDRLLNYLDGWIDC